MLGSVWIRAEIELLNGMEEGCSLLSLEARLKYREGIDDRTVFYVVPILQSIIMIGWNRLEVFPKAVYFLGRVDYISSISTSLRV